MEKILVISDTHGSLVGLRQAIEREGTPDLLLDLGDSVGKHNEIMKIAGCPAKFVRGNCDYAQELPDELLVRLGKHLAFLTHGHRYQVYFGTQTLVEAARSRGADIAIFGHLHVPMLYAAKDMTVLNPGSISFPRQSGYESTYCVIEADDQGELNFIPKKL